MSYPLFVKRDLDGFFGLFIDNLVQLLLIVALCGQCGIGPTSELLLSRILPGAAVSILLGNLFYAWQAHRLAKREGRDDITALPYGINTPSLLVYVFFVMIPAYKKTGDPTVAWQMGLIACLGSGVIELVGSLVAEWIRRRTPRAALLSTLAGIAIGFISMTFALQIFQRPIVAMVPLGMILLTYFAHVRFPLGLPGGFLAVLLGTLTAWGLNLVPESIHPPMMSGEAVREAWESRGWQLPQFFGPEIWDGLQSSDWIGYLSVIIPMGLFNVLGSLQNVESAEAAGDRFATRPSLAANGIGTIAAALCGSCFPTTIYIGHPGWKALGSRAGYSTLNGMVITAICLTGTVGVIHRIVPMEAGIAIVLWIGVIITAQAFQATPSRHAAAVAIGLFPAIAAWGATVMMGAFLVSGGTTLQAVLEADVNAQANGFLIHGMLLIERGYIFTCVILSAIAATLIERRFWAATVWSLVGATFAALGLTHAYQMSGNISDYLFRFSPPAEAAFVAHGDMIAIGYAGCAVLFAIAGKWQSIDDGHASASPDGGHA